jgi:Kazal-type serine protease inhibitor domain
MAQHASTVGASWRGLEAFGFTGLECLSGELGCAFSIALNLPETNSPTARHQTPAKTVGCVARRLMVLLAMNHVAGLVVIALSVGCADASSPAGSVADGHGRVPGMDTTVDDAEPSPASSPAAGSSTGSSTDAAGPVLCGGAYARECNEGQYCAFNSGGCGTVGHCTRLRDECPDEVTPVCGCDGQTYGNSCNAGSVGVSSQHEGACAPEAVQSGCGPYRCDEGYYCLDKGDPTAPWRYACVPLPVECGDVPACACLAERAACTLGQTCEPNGVSVTVACRNPLSNSAFDRR